MPNTAELLRIANDLRQCASLAESREGYDTIVGNVEKLEEAIAALPAKSSTFVKTEDCRFGVDVRSIALYRQRGVFVDVFIHDHAEPVPFNLIYPTAASVFCEELAAAMEQV